MQAAVNAFSLQLAYVLQELHEEQVDHLRFVNELRARVLGFKELPLDTKSRELILFRNDCLVYLEKIVQVATNVNREPRRDEGRSPVASPLVS